MKHASLLVVVAVALALTGCGSDDSSAERSRTESTVSDAAEHAHGETGDVLADARRIEVAAGSFEFDPTEINVEAGEGIAIVLTSSDTLHDVVIDDLDAHVAADRGEIAEGGFRADSPGSYTYYCSVPGHRSAGMEGTLVVE